jgi:NDP-sugar pyrophosphorylase family protein
MKAVILAGGTGTRLRPVTLEIPKPLITVKRKPIINYLIDLFTRHGVRDIALVIHKDHVQDYDWWKLRFAGNWPDARISIFTEDNQAGTFGALRYVKDWAKGETLLVSNGDEIKELNLHTFIKFHETKKPLASIALVKVKEPQHYGVALMKEHLITEFLEKPQDPPSSYISSGLYVLSPSVFKYDNPTEQYLMLENYLFPKLAAQKKLAGYKVKKGKWFDCGTFERWEEAIKNV